MPRKKWPWIVGTVALLAVTGIVFLWVPLRTSWRMIRYRQHLADTTSVETARYKVIYPKIFEKSSREFIEQADACHDQVLRTLALPPGEKIEVHYTDLYFVLGVDDAGRAAGGKIAINRSNLDGLEGAWKTLVHETAHVYLNALSENALEHHRPAANLFDEGVAVLTEVQAKRRDPGLLTLEAAWYADKANVRLEDLFGDRRPLPHFGQRAVYPLGMLFVRGLVDEYGSSAISDLTKAMARYDREPNADRALFLPKSLDAAHFDAAKISERFSSLLKAAKDEHAEQLAKLPPLTAKLTKRNGYVEIRVERASEIGEFFPSCQILSLEGKQITSDLTKPFSGGCAVATRKIPDGRFKYQLCWSSLNVDLCQPYVEARVEG